MNTRLITADTPVQAALRLRPRLADNLSAFGAEPWDRPAATLRELFGNRDTLERFLDIAAAAPVPEPGSAWHDLPASHLLDHLTQNHRDFFQVTLPDVAGFFSEWGSLDPDIIEAREDLDAFIRGLRAEIENEEARFFPRVLRDEACLRDPTIDPEFNGGSLRIEVAYRKNRASGFNPGGLRALLDRLRESRAAEDGNPWAELLMERLEDFHTQFEEHERLEAEVLYPMALDAEKTLYNLSIAGATHPAGVGATV